MSESETNEMQDLGQLYFKEEEIMKKIFLIEPSEQSHLYGSVLKVRYF